ncbi:UNVERIFIED_CONTAM: Heat stress transcription factor A-7a [Sesamum latifolium]|uniref:Heat stress transcription factor A-7a n=1 Tax=Sesamum latifolium TaxID=2727402 RepID=A0AAW2TUR5_9LAMI
MNDCGCRGGGATNGGGGSPPHPSLLWGSSDMLGHKNGGGGLSPPAFLTKTFSIVNDPNTNSLISWNLLGTSFIVWDPLRFSAEILPRHFKHGNFSSFVSQLNQYGFRRVRVDALEYANPNFQAGKEHLLTNIKRRDRHDKTNNNVIATRTRILRDEVDESKLEIQKLKRQQDEMELRIMAYATVTNIENKSKTLIRNWAKTCDEIVVGKMRELETGKQNSDDEHRKKRKLDTVVEDFDGKDVHQDQEGNFDPKKSSGDYAFWKKILLENEEGCEGHEGGALTEMGKKQAEIAQDFEHLIAMVADAGSEKVTSTV